MGCDLQAMDRDDFASAPRPTAALGAPSWRSEGEARHAAGRGGGAIAGQGSATELEKTPQALEKARNRIAFGEPARPARRSAFAALVAFAALAAPAGRAAADPDALWRIVHGACVVHAEAGEGPRPCEQVDLARGEAEGVAILKDINGVAQMLAIPTRRIAGVEDPQMLAADAPPAFAEAWAAKPLLEARLGGKQLPREAVALALNSKWARSQGQLHIHVDCLRPEVAEALEANRAALTGTWRAMTVPLSGRTYFARRLDSADLADAEPIKLLADGIEGAKADMGAWTLAAVGAEFDGKPGFVLLANAFSLAGGGHAEDLQDHDCAIAKVAP